MAIFKCGEFVKRKFCGEIVNSNFFLDIACVDVIKFSPNFDNFYVIALV